MKDLKAYFEYFLHLTDSVKKGKLTVEEAKEAIKKNVSSEDLLKLREMCDEELGDTQK